MVPKSDPISCTEVQQWSGPEFPGRGGDGEDLEQHMVETIVLLIINGRRAWLSDTSVHRITEWVWWK